nr:MAG TPA: hypothetical protein [Caudoviricetes sp.]
MELWQFSRDSYFFFLCHFITNNKLKYDQLN